MVKETIRQIVVKALARRCYNERVAEFLARDDAPCIPNFAGNGVCFFTTLEPAAQRLMAQPDTGTYMAAIIADVMDAVRGRKQAPHLLAKDVTNAAREIETEEWVPGLRLNADGAPVA